jgi:hypothetical protein
MADEPRQSWRSIRRELPVDERRVRLYQRLMEAERLLDGVRRRRGLDASALDEALDAVQADAGSTAASEHPNAVYLATLARYVSALGGRLEVSAVFEDETVTLPPEAWSP